MRRVAACAVVAVLAGLTASCGEPRYRYETVKELGLYWRVPRDWSVIDQTAEAQQNVDPGTGRLTVRRELFDSAPSPDPAHFADASAPDMVGRLDIVLLPQSQADNTSLRSARQALAGLTFDPIDPPEEVRNGGAYELRYVAPVGLQDGAQGTFVQFVASYDPDNDGPSSFVKRQFLNLSYVNPLRQSIYLFSFRCSVECNQEQIKDAVGIMTSLTFAST